MAAPHRDGLRQVSPFNEHDALPLEVLLDLVEGVVDAMACRDVLDGAPGIAHPGAGWAEGPHVERYVEGGEEPPHTWSTVVAGVMSALSSQKEEHGPRS